MANFANPYSAKQSRVANPYGEDVSGLVDSVEGHGRSEFGKGWESAGIGEEVNAKLSAANEEEINGNTETAAVLKQQAKELMALAAKNSPRVQNATDIKGLGDAVDWGMGAAGNIRSSIIPMAAGAAGGLAGAVLTVPTGGVVNPVTGALAASTAAGWKPNRDEIIANAMQSGDTIASPQEIRNKANAYSIPVSMLDGLVTAVGGKVISGFGRNALREAAGKLEGDAVKQAVTQLGEKATEKEVNGLASKLMAPQLNSLARRIEAEEIKKQGVKSYIAKGAEAAAVEEGWTEGAQEILGQAAQNELQGNAPLSDIDGKRVFNAAAAGAVPGGVMGAGGNAATAMRNLPTTPVSKPERTGYEIAADLVADTGGWLGDKLGGKEPSDDELAAQARTVFNKLPDFTANVPADADAVTQMNVIHTNAVEHAKKIISNPRDFTADEFKAAQQLIVDAKTKGKGDVVKYTNDLKDASDKSALNDVFNDIESSLPKQSRMGMKAVIDNPTPSANSPLNFLSDEKKNLVYTLVGLDDATIKSKLGDLGMNFDQAKEMVNEAKNFTLGQNSKNTQFGEMTDEGKTSLELTKLWLQQHGKKVDLFKRQAESPEALQAAHMLMTWVNSDFGAAHSEGQTTIPRKILDVFGDDAHDIISSMTDMSEKQGLYSGENKKRVLGEVKKHINDQTGANNFIMKSLTPLADANWNTAKSQNIINLLSKANGKVGAQTFKALQESFGNNTQAVVDHFKKNHDSVRDPNAKMARADGSMTVDGDESTNSNLEEKGSLVEQGYENEDGVSQTTAPVFKNQSKANEYFDTKNDFHKKQLDEVSATHLKGGEDHTARSVAQVGKVTREIEKAAELKGKSVESLTDRELFKIKAGLVLQHFPDIRKVPSRRLKGMSDFAEKQRAADYIKYERQVEAKARQIEGQYKALRLDEHEGAKPGINFSEQDVKDLELNADLRDPYAGNVKNGGIMNPKLGPAEGKIVLKYKGKPFVTTTQMLIGKMFGVKDGTNQSTKEYEGTAQTAHQMVMDAISSLQQHEGFSKFVGVIRNGKIVEGIPDDLRLYLSKKTGDTHTVGLAKQQAAEQSRNTESSDYDPETSEGTRNRTVGLNKFEMYERMQQVMISLPKEERARIVAAFQNKAVRAAEFKPLYDRYMPKTTVEVVGTKPAARNNKVEEGVVGTGTLADFDPTSEIQRDEHGFAATGDMTMQGALMVGTTKKVTTGEPRALPSTKEIASAEILSKNFPEKVQDAKDWIVAAARKGIPDMLKRLESISNEQGRVLKLALEDLLKLGSSKLESLYQLDKGTGKQLNARLTNAYMLLEKKGAYAERAGTEGTGTLEQNRGDAEKTNGLADEGRTAEAGQADAGKSETGVVDKQANWTIKQLGSDLKTFAATIKDFTQEKLEKLWDTLDNLHPDSAYWDGKEFPMDRKTLKTRASEFMDHVEDRLEGEYVEGETKNSKQKSKRTPSTPEQQDAAEAVVEKLVGKNKENIIILAVKKMTGSGSWTDMSGQDALNIIRLAINGDIMGAAFHESFHELVSIMRKNGAGKAIDIIERVAMSPLMQKRLRLALEGHPEAIKQLSQPEEAAAFMFQMWSMNPEGFKIGPETRTTFEKIKDMLKTVAGFVSDTLRAENQKRIAENLDAITAEHFMRQLSDGVMANKDTRAAVAAAMNKDATAHENAVKNINSAYNHLVNTAGQFVMSSEAVMEATGNKHLAELVRMFHQKAGTAMRNGGTYSDGLRMQTNKWLNKVEDILLPYKDNKEELELARQHLSKGTDPDKIANPVVQEIVKAIRKFFDEDMQNLIKEKDIRRFDYDANHIRKGEWNPISFRKGYWSQVINTDYLSDNMDTFIAELQATHPEILKALAAQANLEAIRNAQRGYTPKGDENKASATVEGRTITEEDIAAAIATRLLNSQGQFQLDETESELGMTPMARAVNRRKLDWLDMNVFDKYMSKDLSNIMSTYTRSIVKRGEYQSRFGYDGSVIQTMHDKAVLHELGGDELVKAAEKALPDAVARWEVDAQAAKDAGEAFKVPEPTLRSVGQKINEKKVGTDAHHAALEAAVSKLELATKAVQALEGTLGNDITPTLRSMNSWLVTYQNFRTLSMMLFTSFQDVNGLLVNGGTLNDAWVAFTTGIKEIGNTWKNVKNDGEMMQRAEMWGAVDAGSFLDALGQAHASPFMTGKAKVLSDKFFKYTGAEGWNRGIRSVASSVAERIITEWKTEGLNYKDKAAVARLERLFGKDAKAEDIKLDAEGRLDIDDAANQAAVTRWMLDAVPAPTAAHRPIWGSDPHFQMFMHLKNYTYTFHRVMLKGAVEQAKLGNYQPIAQLSLGYIPIAIAAGAIKEMLIPGDEPAWMKGGLGSYLEYGFARAGVLGVPQMYSANLFSPSKLLTAPSKTFDNFDPVAMVGTTPGQLEDIMVTPFFDSHTVIDEALGSLPGGNVLRRLARP